MPANLFSDNNSLMKLIVEYIGGTHFSKPNCYFLFKSLNLNIRIMKNLKSNWKSLLVLIVPVIVLVTVIIYNVITIGTTCYLITM